MANFTRGCGSVFASLLLLAVAGCNSQPSEVVAKRSEALTPGPSFTLQLPPQLTAGGSGLTTSTTLTLGDRVQVKQPVGSAFAGIVNLGSGQTTLGRDDKTGDVWSVGSVQLQDRALVSGFLKTAGALTQGTGTSITGTIQQHQPLTPPTLGSVTVQFQNGAAAVTLANDSTRTLNPGDYAAVNVGARAILALSAGDYRFDSLATQPQSTLRLTTTSGPIRVFIRTSLNWNSTVTAAAGDPMKLLVGYVGTTALTINTPFTGTLLSPSADITLPTVSSPHAGAFFAKSLLVQPGVVITTQSFQQPCQGVVTDDGNACTTDSCDPVTGLVSHVPVANGVTCSDGNGCTRSDTCQAGTCVGANPVVCTAQDQCHAVGVCAPATGLCSNPVKANGAACTDGNACTQSDTCQAGACVGASPVTCAAPDQCHSAGTCNSATGVCSNPPKADGSACADGNACTQNDTCQAGSCVGANPVLCAALDQCHVAGSCDPTSGVCSSPVKANGTACSDGSACTQADTCQAGACVGASPVLCSALDQCHVAGSCNPASGVCSNPAKTDGAECSDGNACTQADTCQLGSCVGSSPVVCSAQDQCHVAGACNVSTGACTNPAKANGSACSDGNACTQSDACQGGACVGASPVLCAALDQCHVAGSCNAGSGICSNPAKSDGTACNDANACTGGDACGGGVCQPGSAVASDDGNPCTADSCDPLTGVSHAPVAAGTACDDGDVCNGHEACNAIGFCAAGTPLLVDDGNPCTTDTCDAQGVKHTPVAAGTSCADSNACNGAEVCNGSGSCAAGTQLVVDDGNPCTVDTCDPTAGVKHTALANGSACDDATVCNGHESCQQGSCGPGTAPVVDDSNPCTTDACDPVLGVSHIPSANGSSCADGNACNGSEACDGSGHCQAGTPPSTDDGNPCTADSCSPTAGVAHTPVAAGSSCADSNVCNGTEQCNGLGVCAPGTALVVDDGNPCTADTCDPVSGAKHVSAPNGTSCADSNACNGSETCQQGACAGGAPPVLDDANPCTSDSCDPTQGVVHTPTAVGTNCSDGNPCNGAETCSGFGQCVSGTPTVVDDGNPCTADTCDPIAGVTHAPVAAGISCADTTICNGEERCDAMGICATGTPLVVDDGDPCTADSCDPVDGVLHTPIAGCGGGTPGQVFETRASIMGRVISADGSPVTVFTVKVFNDRLDSDPRSDVVVTVNSDGTFRIRLSEFAQSVADHTPPQHVLVRFESDGFPSLLRSTYVRPGEVAALGDLVVLQRDPTVTVIGPEGGTAQDSQGTLQLQIPPGALAQPTPVRLTPIPTRAQFPAPLPSNTVTMYGMEIEPSGTVLSLPATLRVKNTLNLPIAMRIPVGTIDDRFGDWTHEGFAVWDGTRFATTISHFSPHDCNGPRLGELVEVVTDGSNRNKNKGKGCGVGSSVSYGNGALEQAFDVPLQSAAGHDYSLSLNYTSELSGSVTVGQGPPSSVPFPQQSLIRSFVTQGTRLACVPPGGGGCAGGGGGGPPCLIGGGGQGIIVSAYGLNQRVKLLNFDVDESSPQPPNAQNSEPAFYVPLPDDSDGNPVRSGYLPAHITSNIAVQGSGTCVGGGGGFAVSANFGSVPPVRLPIATGDLLDFPVYQLVVHRRGSPMGSGWAFNELSTLYRAPDGVSADIVHGDGEQESFHPYPLSKKVLDFNNSSSNSLAVDLQTGEVFSARDGAGIQRLDFQAGAPIPIFSGALFGGRTPVDFKVTYVGGARRFLATTRSTLFEIGSDGSSRSLATFVDGPSSRIPTVAGVGRYAYFAPDEQSAGGSSTTDVVTVSRIDLTDPDRKTVVITATENGDLNLDPRGEVQAQNFQFLHPSGLAPAFDGGLYVSDDRRHAVYHLAPNGAGEVGPDSLVSRALGSGVDSMVGGLGKKMPALETAIRQPGPLSLAPDGMLYVRGDASLGGLLAFDPVEKTTHWVAFDKSATINATDSLSSLATLSFRDGSLAPLSGEKVIVPLNGLAFQVTTQLSSEYQPLRTLTFSDTGASVVDTESDTVEQYAWTSVGKNEATLIAESLRSGEPIRTIVYKDPDRVDFIQDAAGGRVSFGYDASGHLNSVTDPAQRTTHFNVDADGNLREVIYPSGEARRFEYQDFRMTSSTHPNGEVSTYTYGPDGTLQTARRPGGGTTTVQSGLSREPKFDSVGRLFHESLVTDDRGVQHALSLNAAGAVLADKYTADGQSYDVENVYAPLLGDPGNLDGVTNRYLRFSNTTINGLPVGPVTNFDRLGRAVSVTQSPTDASFKYGAVFDGNGRLSQLAFGTGGIDWAYTYDSVGHLIKSADVSSNNGTLFPETGRRTTYDGFRSQDGQPTTVTAHSTPTTLSYDSIGLVSSAVDTVGRSTTMTHDAAGNTLSVNDGATTLQYGHDLAGRVTSITDAENNTTTLSYETAGCSCSNGNRVTAIATPDLSPGEQWAMSYDPDGDLQATTTPLGETETYDHNAQRDLVGVTDRAGRPTAFTYDQLGRQASITDPIGRVGVFEYSVPTAASWSGPTLYAQSQTSTPAPVALTAALGDGQYQVGSNGFQPGGDRSHVSLYRDATFQSSQWLAMDRLDRVQTREDRAGLGVPFDSTVPGPFHTQGTPFIDEFHDYTSPFPLLDIEETFEAPSRFWSSQFERNPELDITSFDTFLGIGLVNFVSDTTVAHDSAGRLTGVSTQSASSSIQYLPNGQVDLVGLAMPVIETNPTGPLCVSGLNCGSGLCSKNDGTTGRCLEYTVERGSQRESFQYDARGLVKTRNVLVIPEPRSPTTSQGGDFEYQYDRVGRNTHLVYPDDHEREQVFDALGRLTSRCYVYHDGSASHCYTATYDAVGNPKILTDPDMRSEVEYDDLDRITEVRRYVPPSATVPAHVESYAYNALGGFSVYDGSVVDDRRPRLDGAGKASAGIPATFAGLPVGLDSAGRVTLLNGQTFQYYNYHHHLETLTSGGQKQTFNYDALERPIGIHTGPVSDTPPTSDQDFFYSDFSGSLSGIIATSINPHVPPDPPALPETAASVGYDGIDHPLWIAENGKLIYTELDAIGNVRHLHAGLDPSNPNFTGDLGGYSYSAFGKTLSSSDPGGVTPPGSITQPFQWQGKRLIAPNLYDSRARVWSADLGAFLQPDEYGFLTRGGTLWSWPGQNAYRWRDPSGRFLDGGAAEAGEAALAALEAAGAVGEVAAGWAVLPAAIAGYAGYNIYNQLDDFYHPIISHAENNQGKPGPGEPCKTESGGGGAKGPPAAKGDVGADDDEGPASPNWGRPETLQDHFDRHGAGVGASTPEEYARMAEQFRAEANRAGYESFNDSKGVQRIYDQATNRFGAYNADGTTRTFYTPDKGYAYWIGQVLKFK